MPPDSPSHLQGWIERMNAGDPAARDELVKHAYKRLRRIARKMRQDFSRVKGKEDTDDVLHNALIRFLGALKAVRVTSPAEVFGLATLQIRRELLDLARHYASQEAVQGRPVPAGEGDNSGGTPPPYEKATTTYDPKCLAAWREFHARVEELPTEQREVFGLLWYQGLTRTEAAKVLNISEATVKRRWLASRLALQDFLEGQHLDW